MYRPIVRRRSLTFYRSSNRSDTIPTFYAILPNSSPFCVSPGHRLATPAWVCALISSDCSSSRARGCDTTWPKAVVELCRNEGLLEEEEVEWAKMFTEAIYYANNHGSFPCSLTYLALISTSQTLNGLVYESSHRASMCQSAPHKLHIGHNRCFGTRLSDTHFCPLPLYLHHRVQRATKNLRFLLTRRISRRRYLTR
jgi:hypothetical protein